MCVLKSVAFVTLLSLSWAQNLVLYQDLGQSCGSVSNTCLLNWGENPTCGGCCACDGGDPTCSFGTSNGGWAVYQVNAAVVKICFPGSPYPNGGGAYCKDYPLNQCIGFGCPGAGCVQSSVKIQLLSPAPADPVYAPTARGTLRSSRVTPAIKVAGPAPAGPALAGVSYIKGASKPSSEARLGELVWWPSEKAGSPAELLLTTIRHWNVTEEHSSCCIGVAGNVLPPNCHAVLCCGDGCCCNP